MDKLVTENSLKELQIPELIPVSRFNDFFPYPSVGALRQYIFHSKKYKFENVIRKMGKRLYISVSAFNQWVEDNSIF